MKIIIIGETSKKKNLDFKYEAKAWKQNGMLSNLNQELYFET